MDWQQIFVLLLLASVVTLYITRWLPIAVTSLLVPPILFGAGILDLDSALSGFSNSATITIACMFVLSAGLFRTGALDYLTEFLKKHAQGSPLRLLVLLAATVPFISAVMNNIPVVAMLLPVVLALAREMDVQPSRLLIPMSYFAILGGTLTLVGTGTNILVDDFYRGVQLARGDEATGLGMFSFTPLGFILLTAGVAFILLLGRKLLPDRTAMSALLPKDRSAQFLTEILVDKESPLVGQSVADVIPWGGPVRLIEYVRKEQVFIGREAKDFVFETGDTMVLTGTPKETAEFIEAAQATVQTGGKKVAPPAVHATDLLLGEAVVLPGSRFVGRRLGGLALHTRYGVKVLAIQRGGVHQQAVLRNSILQAGDVLLVQAPATGFAQLRDTEAVLVVEGLDQAIRRQKRVWLAVALVLAVVFGAALTPWPIVAWALAGAALMVGTRCLRVDEAIRSLDFPVLFLLIGTIPLGLALQATGLTEDFVRVLLGSVGSLTPFLILSILYLLTSVITEFLSNKATAILLAPIALQIATQLGVSERPFLFAICFAASASFMTPFGYPTNLIVMGPGGYKFTDYPRMGIPLNLLIWVIASLLIPVFWPF